MGGHAFQAMIDAGSAQFPRMSPEVYRLLKLHAIQALQPHFEHVAAPPEDPEKPDYGDLDLAVFGSNSDKVNVELRTLMKEMVKADYAVSPSGPRFYCFAIANTVIVTKPQDDLTSALARVSLNNESKAPVYHQVDVNFLKDKNAWEATLFYGSYGDLGMILGLLCKPIGLSYSKHGLKIAIPEYMSKLENIPFFLSYSTERILSFLGLDYEVWRKGFINRLQIFEWVLSSRFAQVDALLKISPSHLERPMYKAFLSHIQSKAPIPDTEVPTTIDPTALEEALNFFEKRNEYETLVTDIVRRKALKLGLNGRIIMEITGLEGPIIRRVIEEVKRKVKEDDFIAMTTEDRESVIRAAGETVKAEVNNRAVDT